MTPNYVDTKDIEQAVASRTWGTVCKGLEMKEERIRRYATEQLWKAGAPAEAQLHLRTHQYTRGWLGCSHRGRTHRFAERYNRWLLCGPRQKPELPKRTEAVVALAQTSAPIARAALADIASAEGDIEARARAA